MNVIPLNRRKSLPSNYKFNAGFLSVPSMSSVSSPKKGSVADLDILKFKDTKTHERLLAKLEKSRKQIIKDNDI